jgi:hypothetical protein
MIAYLMHSKGMSADKAYDFVKLKRNCINPNLSFIRQLQEYDEILRSEGKIASLAPSSSTTTSSPTEHTPFLVHYLRTAMPNFTQNISDDQLAITAKRCEYSYIQVLASLRTQSTQPAAC